MYKESLLVSLCLLPLDKSYEVMRFGAVAPTMVAPVALMSFIF